MHRQLLLALSVANLNFLSVWNELLYLGEDQLYFTPLPTRADFGWILVNWLVLAGMIFTLFRVLELGRRRKIGWSLAVWCLLAVNPANFVRMQLGLTLEAVGTFSITLIAATSVAVAIAVFRAPRTFLAGIELVVLILSPLVLGNAAQALWHAAPFSQYPDLASALPIPVENPNPLVGSPQRVVWIVFDELDGRMLFDERHEHFETPAFEALRGEASFFSRVTPPGGHTIQAMPSLWLGERVVKTRTRGASQLDVQFEGRPGWRPLTEQPHLFRRLHASGASIGLAGFYHPYCRLFAGVAQTCSSGSFAVTRGWQPRDFTEVLLAQWRALTPLWRRAVYLDTHHHLVEQATALAIDPDLDFVAIHLGVPHDPPIYDAARGEFTRFRLGSGYRDNVVLADRALAEISGAMRGAAMWQSTTVVVSSDHGWKGIDGYDPHAAGAVPLFVKLPGQRSGEVDPRDFDSLVLPRLLYALWEGALTEPVSLAAWIDSAATER